MQARYYDPLLARFYSNDPMGFTQSNPQSFNRYLYVNNNPYRYTDPTGMCGTGLCVLAAFLIKEAASELFEYATGVPAPSVKNAGKFAMKKVALGVKQGIKDQALNVKKKVETDKFGNVISREPKSLQDKMTLDSARQGNGIVKIDKLGDPKYKDMQKIEVETISSGGVKSNVHYVKDPATGNTMDFKFKKHSTDYINKYEKNQ
jgi:hypothetical protein